MTSPASIKIAQTRPWFILCYRIDFACLDVVIGMLTTLRSDGLR